MGELSPSGEAIRATLNADLRMDILAKCMWSHLWETICSVLEAYSSQAVESNE
jgi:hypothetical protein